MTNEEIRDQLQQAIKGERVMLFMKGTPEMPQCGFSRQVVSILEEMQTEYSALDILPDPRIRQELSEISGWPTIPQLFATSSPRCTSPVSWPRRWASSSRSSSSSRQRRPRASRRRYR